MHLEATQPSVVERAWDAAIAAAERAGVAVTDALHPHDFRAAASLFATVWKTPRNELPVTSELMRALSHAGNYVSAAFRDRQLVGASVGFLHATDGHLGLHSHITGVLPDVQGRSAGLALKLHQRAWALERGITVAHWTFDPLVRRNAYFNIRKLGAEVTEFLPNFYGPMSDGINAGDDTDRGFVTWRLTAERVDAAIEGQNAEPEVDALREAGAVVVLDEDPRGAPELGPEVGAPRLCRVPQDIVALRASQPELAHAWRVALREALGDAFAAGLRATGFTRSGWYVLERP